MVSNWKTRPKNPAISPNRLPARPTPQRLRASRSFSDSRMAEPCEMDTPNHLWSSGSIRATHCGMATISAFTWAIHQGYHQGNDQADCHREHHQEHHRGEAAFPAMPGQPVDPWLKGEGDEEGQDYDSQKPGQLPEDRNQQERADDRHDKHADRRYIQCGMPLSAGRPTGAGGPPAAAPPASSAGTLPEPRGAAPCWSSTMAIPPCLSSATRSIRFRNQWRWNTA